MSSQTTADPDVPAAIDDVGIRLLEGNTPLLLDAPGSLWTVVGGHVDVFVVAVADGQPAGARRYVCGVGPGEALFGVDPAAVEGWGLLAVGTVGTRVREGDVAGLNAGAGTAALLECWIAALATGAAPDANLQTEQQLASAQAVTLRAGQRARPAEGVLWLRVGSGAVSVLDALSLGPDAPAFPLAEAVWVRASGATALQPVSTAEALAAGEAWEGLGAFHRFVLDRLVHAISQREAQEADRLRRELDFDRMVRRAALAQLAGVLDPVPDAPYAAASDDHLLEACRLVGQALGVTVMPPSQQEGASSLDPLARIARASRLRMRQVTLPAGWWRGDTSPMLGFLAADGAPVAILRRAPGRFDLVNPADGARRTVDADLVATLAKEAWVFYVPFPDRPLGVFDLFRFGLAGSRRDMARIGLMGMATGLVALLPPIATSIVFGRLIPQSEEANLLMLAVVLVLTAISSALFQIVRSVAITRVEARIDASIQPAIWDRLLRLPTRFFRDYSAGNLASRAMAIDTARQILTGTAISTILGSVFSVFSYALLFYYDVKLALVATVFMVVALVVTIASTWRQLRYQRRMTEIQANISGMVLQFLTGIAKLRVAGAEDRAFATWAKVFAQQKRQDLEAQTTSNGFAVFGSLWPLLGTVVIFAVVAQQGLDSISTATLLAFLVAFGQFMAATLMTASAISGVLQCVPLYEQARPILRALPEVDATRADPGTLSGEIEISHVSFRYTSDGPLALTDVSLRVEPGEFVAIVGPSGAGKSSLIRLLLGFDTQESGSIYYDGKDLAGLDTEAVRRQMGVVTQDSRVLPGSIQQNILGTALLTVDDAWEAARLAGLDEDIRQMPMGMQTIISEGGATFSGGQLQRLMIARAIVRKPRILLFDEATSALDNRTQAIVSRSLERLQATRVVIAHRLSTIENADRIYVLEAGRVVQTGAYADLIAQPGPFANLAKRQLA